MLSRRGFIRRMAAGLLAAALVREELVPRMWSPLPTLWGDGIHDDTPALQAFIDGQPVLDAATGRVMDRTQGPLRIGGTCLIASGPVVIPAGDSLEVIGSVSFMGV